MDNGTFAEKISNEIRLSHSRLVKRSDGIIEIHCADDFTYEPEHIRENQEALLEFHQGKKLLVLNILGKYTLASSDARAFVAKGTHKTFIEAEAFLIHSLAQQLIGSFYLKINKPVVPTSYFSFGDKAKAENWLMGFEKKQDSRS
jgi:hypothetical protein